MPSRPEVPACPARPERPGCPGDAAGDPFALELLCGGCRLRATRTGGSRAVAGLGRSPRLETVPSLPVRAVSAGPGGDPRREWSLWRLPGEGTRQRSGALLRWPLEGKPRDGSRTLTR
jgi:hypothetical protein